MTGGSWAMERGGIQFDYGLDEGQSPGETTLVNLLGHEVFVRLWADYRAEAHTFGQPKVIQVAGKG